MSIASSISSAASRLISDAARDVLLGISTYTKPRSSFIAIDEDFIEQQRKMLAGGLLTPPPASQTRWYLEDLENAEFLADQGDLRRAGQLMAAARKDGHLIGILSTRTDGLVRLPRQFRGDAEVIATLERGHGTTRSAFDEMFPPAELAQWIADGLLLGVGVGEFIPVRGRQYPVFVRLDPQFLRFVWAENRWFYSSIYGLLPITPGDGRWMLYTPGGRISPWQTALWKAVGQAWIRKQHANLSLDNWQAKLAHPARVAVSPQGAAEEQKQSVFQALMAWGMNTVFGLPNGYDAKLLESNGRGWESFVKTVADSNEEYTIAIAGQTVTTDGGTGFANADIHKSIRADLIKASADTAFYTINTQGLPVYVASVWGPDAVLSRPVAGEWDVTPPKDRNSEANAMQSFGVAVQTLGETLAPYGLAPNVQQLVDRYHIPTIQVQATIVEPQPQQQADAQLTPGAPAPKQLPAAAPKPAPASVASDDDEEDE